MKECVKINPERLWTRLNEVGHIGSDPRGGVSRFAWEPAYREAVVCLLRWIEEAGLTARIDTVGNVFARLEGAEPQAPAVLSGSHFDTVPQGGCFDGLAGVMGALEALTAIKESGLPHRRPLEMVAFINEEASQFLGGTFGSKAMCGMLPDDYAFHLRHRQSGQLLSDAMREYGMGVDPSRLAESKIDPQAYCAFLEMHIEQGRYLLDREKPFSIVSCVAGIKQFYITFLGKAAHAGGMAMADRHDALAAAAAVITAVESLARRCGPDTRGTVGYVSVSPCEHNIIADRVTISVDFREADDEKWEALYTDLMEVTQRECEKRGLTWTVNSTCNLKPAHCAPELIQLLEEAAAGTGVEKDRMISFPAHDSMNMSRIMPMGMLFLRSSNDGLSHCPEESTTREDMVLGTQVLTNALLAASNWAD